MTYHPGIADAVLLALAASLATGEVVLFARLRRPDGDALRFPAYVYFIAYQWALVACIVALWIVKDRPWNALLLGPPVPWRFALGVVLAAAYIGLVAVQLRTLRKPGALQRVRAGAPELEVLAPRTPRERRLFTYVAVTAGCCEEVIFRGFVFAFVASCAGMAVSALVTAGTFGVYHAYYGAAGVVKTALVGLVLGGIAIATGSLVAPIILHIAIDLVSGDVGYRALRAAPASAGPVAPSQER